MIGERRLDGQTMVDKKSKLPLIFAVVLSIMPILDPYKITVGSIDIMLTDIIAVLFCLTGINKSIRRDSEIPIMLAFFLLFTLIASLITPSRNTDYLLAMKVFAVYVVYWFGISSAWGQVDKEWFYKAAICVGVISAILLIFQFIAMTAGIYTFYSGVLPFKTGEYNSFGAMIDQNTGQIRVHSFFEEPSYFAIYELPVLVYCIKNKKIFTAVLIGLACILSSSLLGVMGILFILIYSLFFDFTGTAKQKAALTIILAVAFCAALLLYLFNGEFKILVDTYLKRLTTIQTSFERSNSSVSQRLLGNIELFNEYNILNKIIGVGFNQYHLYFGLSKNYSNDFVSTLLDFGILGVLILAVIFISMRNKTRKNARIYFWIYILVFSTDHIWFNNLFFFLLAWITLSRKEKEPIFGADIAEN